MTDSLRVLALAPYPSRAPSTRYRLAQLREPLAEVGVRLHLRSFLDEAAWDAWRSGGLGAAVAVARRLRALAGTVASAAEHDAVLVQRGVSLVWDRHFLAALERSGRPLLYDFDDAVWLPQEGGRGWLERLRSPEATTAAFCRAAAVVLAGNEHLADFARRVRGRAGDEAVRVLPSVVDTERFRPRAPLEAGASPTAPGEPPLPVVGWVGSDSSLPYLEALAPVLRRLQARTPCRVRVVAGRRRPRLPGVEHEHERWTPGTEVRVFQELDVGLYPLDDTPWARGKCGFKALQYLACGVPCVASPVGVLREIVRPGETGFHATDEEGWVEGCARLLEDPDARRRMGREGRRRVQASYSVEVAVEGMVEALDLARRRR